MRETIVPGVTAMRETIIRFDNELAANVVDFSVQERYADVQFSIDGTLILPASDPIDFRFRADRRLSWSGDDHGGGWGHTSLDNADTEWTQIEDRNTGGVLQNHWEATLWSMAFAPPIDYDAITRKLIADLQAHVDPAVTFLGALKGSLPPA